MITSTYADGRTELLTGLTPEKVVEHTERMVADPGIESIRVQMMKSRSQYPDNRKGQRAYEADMRKAMKRGPNLTPPKKRKKGTNCNGKH